MLRASSAGLISAFPSAIRPSRPWNAFRATRTISVAIPSNSLSYSRRPDDLPSVQQSSSQRVTFPSYSSPNTGGNEGSVPESSSPRRRVKRRPDLGLSHQDRLNQKKTSKHGRERSRERRSRFRTHRAPPQPKSPRGNHLQQVDAVESVISRNGLSSAGHHERRSRQPFQLHHKIELYLRSKLDTDTGLKLIRLLRTIASGEDVDDSWEAYIEITRLQIEDPIVAALFPHTPNAVLHRLSRHLARLRPITKSHFPRLLAVMQHLWDAGQNLPVEAWNTLINFAGKGYRTGVRKEYEMAISIFGDMIAGRCPGSTLGKRITMRNSMESRESALPVQPDLITFNTLLHIAARSLSKHSIQHAISLLRQSGLAPDYITHMCLLVYHMRMRNLDDVRATLQKMAQQQLSMPIDGLNAVIWAYAFNDRTDIAWDVFRLLKNNVHRDEDQPFIQEARKRLQKTEHLDVPANLKPDVVTYTLVIQAVSYSGDFHRTFSVLHEFISSYCRNRIHSSTAAAFRAVFLGFSKHTVGPAPPIDPFPSESSWTLANLWLLYKLFLQLPTTEVPTRSTIYWIMVAFDKASGHDIALLQQIWLELKARYESRNPGLFSQPRLQRMEVILFSQPVALQGLQDVVSYDTVTSNS